VDEVIKAFRVVSLVLLVVIILTGPIWIYYFAKLFVHPHEHFRVPWIWEAGFLAFLGLLILTQLLIGYFGRGRRRAYYDLSGRSLGLKIPQSKYEEAEEDEEVTEWNEGHDPQFTLTGAEEEARRAAEEDAKRDYERRFRHERQQVAAKLEPDENMGISQDPFGRVVNITVDDRKGTLPPTQSLRCGDDYELSIFIGGEANRSIVENPTAIPDDELRKVMKDDNGLLLRVVVSSRDFIIETAEGPLWLPEFGASETVRFNITAPKRPTTAHIRVTVYYEQNALQSLMITASVEGTSSVKTFRALTARVEYCLCGSLRNIETTYPARAVNFLTNESTDGTHTFQIVGTNICESFVFGEGEMSTSLRNNRTALLKVCATLNQAGEPIGYRYDKVTNRGTREQFVRDVKSLAAAGRNLYADFVINKDPSFAEELQGCLSKRAHIQVTAVNSARYVFPWSLVYDRPLLVSDRNVVCEEFLNSVDCAEEGDYLVNPLKLSALVETSFCLGIRCPHDGDPNVICPSGFWGYRHVIEQPPSVPVRDGKPLRDLPTHIKTDGTVRMLMTVNQKLVFTQQHYDEVIKLGQYAVSLETTRTGMFSSLKKNPQPNLVYFYCHGGKEEGSSFLSVGDNEKFSPADLVSLRVKLPTNPLIFINGCRTVELTPDDLLDFVRTFSWCQAAGVIGTEIPIPESLAREFATQVFQYLVRPQKQQLGAAILSTRLALLGKYNLMGLAYTPYCHAALGFDDA
jgi:hypothetical protein